MKKNKLEDFIDKKQKPRVKHLQVAISVEFHQEIMSTLKRRGLSAQEVLYAGLKLFVAENQEAKKRLY